MRPPSFPGQELLSKSAQAADKIYLDYLNKFRVPGTAAQVMIEVADALFQTAEALEHNMLTVENMRTLAHAIITRARVQMQL